MTDIDDIINCSICMEIFEKPRVLPCQHTFCEHCLTEYITERMKNKRNGPKTGFNFPCPLCRENISVSAPVYSGATFPLNLTIIALCDTPEVVKSIQDKSEEDDETEEVMEPTKKEECQTSLAVGDADEFEDAIKLYSNDVFADVILYNIIIPISYKKCSRWKILRAVVCLLLFMIAYCVLVQLTFLFGVKILLTPSLFTLSRNIFREIMNHDLSNKLYKVCLFHIVIHISSCAMVAVLLLFTLLGACAIERIITTSTTNNLSLNSVVIIFRESIVMTEHSIRNLHTFWTQLVVKI